MLKRFAFLTLIAVILMVFSAGMAMATTTTVTAASAVTVNVLPTVSIIGLEAITFDATPGFPASGSDIFEVNTNVANSTYDADVTTQPDGLTNMDCSLAPSDLTIPGTTSATLTATITVPFTATAGAHSNGLITVTVAYAP